MGVKFSSVRTNSSLAEVSAGPDGKPAAVYFDAVVHENPTDLNSRPVWQRTFQF